MLFNKGLALSGAMLAAAIPAPSAMTHAQTIQKRLDTDEVAAAVRTSRAATVAVVRLTPAATAPLTVRTDVPAGALPTSMVVQAAAPKAALTVLPVVTVRPVAPAPSAPVVAVPVVTAPAPNLPPAIAAPMPAPVQIPALTAAPAPAPAAPVRAPAEPEPTPVADAVDTVVETVTAAVDAAVAAAASAVRAMVDTVAAVVSPPSTPQQVVTIQPTPAPAQPAPAPAPVQPAPVPAPVEPTPAPAAAGSLRVAKVFTVSTLSELYAALTEARTLAGAEIRVLPGNYGDFIWNRKTFPLGRVYIVAATSTKPVFRSIQANETENMSFHGLKITGAASGRAVQLNSSRNMSLTGSELSGLTNDNNPADENASGVQIRTSTNIVIQDNLIHDVYRAIGVQRSDNVHLRYNLLQYVREGINIAAGSGLEIRGNHIRYIFPRYDLGEHADSIQFWTSGEVVGTSKVRIVENFMSLGGPRPVQGIFIGNETPGARHTDWEISRNVYFGSATNAIRPAGVDNLKASGNVIAASPHSEVTNVVRTAATSGGNNPLFHVTDSTGVSVWNSIMMNTVVINRRVPTLPVNQYDNWDLFDAKSNIGQPWTDFFVGGRPTDDAPPLSAFITRNPSAAFTRNGGITQPFVHGVRAMTTQQALAEALGLMGN
jgi:hypothetical protein